MQTSRNALLISSLTISFGDSEVYVLSLFSNRAIPLMPALKASEEASKLSKNTDFFVNL
jgi:hypothetical protein